MWGTDISNLFMSVEHYCTITHLTGCCGIAIFIQEALESNKFCHSSSTRPYFLVRNNDQNISGGWWDHDINSLLQLGDELKKPFERTIACTQDLANTSLLIDSLSNPHFPPEEDVEKLPTPFHGCSRIASPVHRCIAADVQTTDGCCGSLWPEGLVSVGHVRCREWWVMEV